MLVISQKLQLRFICVCKKRFSKAYKASQINYKELPDGKKIKYVSVLCPKCERYEPEIIVEEE
jgi:type II secretory ATPase GspE/PulE/Tfp pilus assembly ATPase PilB-like protein